MSKPDGGPAYPAYMPAGHESPSGGGSSWSAYLSSGMSLRDWLAGQALTAITMNEAGAHLSTVAEFAYAVADAMIAERAKGE